MIADGSRNSLCRAENQGTHTQTNAWSQKSKPRAEQAQVQFVEAEGHRLFMRPNLTSRPNPTSRGREDGRLGVSAVVGMLSSLLSRARRTCWFDCGEKKVGASASLQARPSPTGGTGAIAATFGGITLVVAGVCMMKLGWVLVV